MVCFRIVQFTNIFTWLVRKLKKRRNIFSAQEKALIVERYISGESLKMIADSLGEWESTVRKVVVDAGAVRTLSESAALRRSRRPEDMTTHRGRKMYFHSRKSGEWIWADSRWEFIRLSQLDNDPMVSKFSRCNEVIPYIFGGKTRRYTPDFTVIYVSGVKVVEEVKPEDFTSRPLELSKFAAAERHFSSIGVEFSVVTENDIGVEVIKNFEFTGFSFLSNEGAEAIQKQKSRERALRNHHKKLAEMTEQQRAEFLAEKSRREKERYKSLSAEQREARRERGRVQMRKYRAAKKALVADNDNADLSTKKVS